MNKRMTIQNIIGNYDIALENIHDNTIENFGKLLVQVVLNSGNTFGNINTVWVLTFLEIEKCKGSKH
jgi:hypothetical protein